MTPEEVLSRLIAEANAKGLDQEFGMELLRAIDELVALRRAHEREVCARIAEKSGRTKYHIAAAIRKRNNVA